jgi:hypothetical protein
LYESSLIFVLFWKLLSLNLEVRFGPSYQFRLLHVNHSDNHFLESFVWVGNWVLEFFPVRYLIPVLHQFPFKCVVIILQILQKIFDIHLLYCEQVSPFLVKFYGFRLQTSSFQ